MTPRTEAIKDPPLGTEPRLSLREEQRNLTRNRVLDAAVAVFGEKSFVDATMEDIARAAGVTRVTVYAHFGGKSAIITALSARKYEIFDQVYAGLTTLPEWTRPAIRSWLETAAAHWRRLAPTLQVLTTAGMATGDIGHKRDRYFAAHERYVAMLADDSPRWAAVSRAEARQRVLMAVLQLESFLALWVAGGWELETEDPLDLLVDTVCHLLSPALSPGPG
jgi:AcrR family transcriptional regulator